MVKLYIANVMTQHQIINYRLDFTLEGSRDGRLVIPPKSTPPIPPGRQMPIGGDLHPNQVGTITDQLAIYGLIAQEDVKRLPYGKKVTYIFNVDREVSPEAIRLAHAHNMGVKIETGKERRKMAAVAASDIVAKTVAEKSDVSAPLTGFDISVEQEEQSENGEARIEEGLRVAIGAQAAAAGPASGRGGRGRRSGRASA